MLAQRLGQFLSELPVNTLVDKIAFGAQENPAVVRNFLETYINEMRVSFHLIESEIRKENRILEVGAGLCLLSLFLRREGYSIVALEPAIGGFELFDTARKAIAVHFSDIDLDILDCTAQQLDPSIHGSFDLIFSNNVLEHIPDWEDALLMMEGVLNRDGYMLHACPNYTVPYEPHYGIPVFRRCVGLSGRLFLPADADDGIWKSLNFITCEQVRKFCKRHRLICRFRQGLLFDALQRVETDHIFSERHKGLVVTVARFIMRSGLGQLVRRIPPSLATPMIVRIEKVGVGTH